MIFNIFSQLNKVRMQAPYLRQAFGLVWVSARPWTITWAILLMVQGLLPIGIVYLTKALVDNLIGVIGTGVSLAGLRPTIMLVGAMAVLLLLTESLRSMARWVRTAQAELVKDRISLLIQEKATTLDLAFYESTDSYDQMHRAKYDASHRPLALLENTGGLVQNCITLVAMASVLTTYAPWLPVLLLVSTLPALWVVLHYAGRFHVWWIENTRADRRSRYLDWMITIRETAAEVRLFNLADHFRSSYSSLRQRLRQERLKITRDQALAEWGASVVGVLIMGLAMGWMVWRAVQGEVTLGDLAMFQQAFQQGQRMMRTLLDNVGQIYQNSLFLETLFGFLALKPALIDSGTSQAPKVLQEGIRFEDIVFRYPGSERPALDHFSLTIPAGKIVAIVGTNGAGKSTLIKLLCRFYDPEEGRVSFDGTNLREVPLDEVRGMISVLFQEPVHYHDTAARNIVMGNLEAESDKRAVEAAAQASGAAGPISRLPEGYEPTLG